MQVVYEEPFENGATAYAIESYLLNKYRQHKVENPEILLGNGSTELLYIIPSSYLDDILEAYTNTKLLVEERLKEKDQND